MPNWKAHHHDQHCDGAVSLALLMGTQNGILNNSGIAIEDFYIFEFFNTCDFTRSKAKLSETNVPKAETSKFLPSFHSNIVSRAMQRKFWPSTLFSTNQTTVDQLKFKTVMLLVERSVEQAAVVEGWNLHQTGAHRMVCPKAGEKNKWFRLKHIPIVIKCNFKVILTWIW